MSRGLRLAAVALLPLLAVGCGQSGAAKKSEDGGFEKAADTSTCVSEAKPYSGQTPADYAADFPVPDGAVVYNVEDRGADGAISTAVVTATLKRVLAVYNGEAQDAGFKITNGETEEHDAEANWEGNGFRGRWALRESATCDGEIVIQVLSRKQ